jgi:hypothetical protein
MIAHLLEGSHRRVTGISTTDLSQNRVVVGPRPEWGSTSPWGLVPSRTLVRQTWTGRNRKLRPLAELKAAPEIPIELENRRQELER